MSVYYVSNAMQQPHPVAPPMVDERQKDRRRNLRLWILLGSCGFCVLIIFLPLLVAIISAASARNRNGLIDVEEKEQPLPYRVQLDPPISGQRARSIHVIGEITKDPKLISIAFDGAGENRTDPTRLVFAFDFSHGTAILTINAYNSEIWTVVPRLSSNTRFAAGDEFDVLIWFLPQQIRLVAGRRNDMLWFNNIFGMEAIDKVTVTGGLSTISSFRYGAHDCSAGTSGCSITLLDNDKKGSAHNLHFAGIARGDSLKIVFTTFLPSIADHNLVILMEIDVNYGDLHLSAEDYTINEETYQALSITNPDLATKYLAEHVNSTFHATRQAVPLGRNQFFEVKITVQNKAVEVRYGDKVVARFEVAEYIGRGPFVTMGVLGDVVLDAYCSAVGSWGQKCMEEHVNGTLDRLELKH